MKRQVVGVLNCTPDSYSDVGRCETFEKAFDYASKLIKEGLDILDIGGESTRPSTPFHLKKGECIDLPHEEEKKRVLPLLKALRREFPHQKISVDTRTFEIAKEAADLGVHYISWVCEHVDSQIAELIASKKNLSLILCHMRGQPKNMQAGNFYDGDIVEHLEGWFQKQIDFLREKGVEDSQIILDPGIGFGKKKPDQDFDILKGIPRLKALGFPIYIGLSRKSFMGAALGKGAEELLPATLTMNAFSIFQGADFIRVHDVAEHKDLVKLFETGNLWLSN